MSFNEFENLIEKFRNVWGLSFKKTEQKLVHFIYNPNEISNLIQELEKLRNYANICDACFALRLNGKCTFCDDPSRDRTTICIVENYSIALKINQTNTYDGMFHILTELINPKGNFVDTSMSIEKLLTRVKKPLFNEVIIATPATAAGEFTASIIIKKIKAINPSIKITMLAKGIPLGGSLDYIDTFTLSTSLKNRK